LLHPKGRLLFGLKGFNLDVNFYYIIVFFQRSSKIVAKTLNFLQLNPDTREFPHISNAADGFIVANHVKTCWWPFFIKVVGAYSKARFSGTSAQSVQNFPFFHIKETGRNS
jgi:hypothetical protein